MRYFLFLVSVMGMTACASLSLAQDNDLAHTTSLSEVSRHISGEPQPFFADVDAHADLNLAMSAATRRGTRTIVVMGANWCHDSRALAAHFEKRRFQTLIRDHFELVYIDVGEKNRNLDIARQFGVDTVAGTPTVFVLSTMGDVLNLDTAPTWRNAASRTSDDVYAYFAGFRSPMTDSLAADIAP